MTDIVGLISHVQNAYARCIDNGDLEAWPDFFDDDLHLQDHDGR